MSTLSIVLIIIGAGIALGILAIVLYVRYDCRYDGITRADAEKTTAKKRFNADAESVRWAKRELHCVKRKIMETAALGQTSFDWWLVMGVDCSEIAATHVVTVLREAKFTVDVQKRGTKSRVWYINVSWVNDVRS